MGAGRRLWPGGTDWLLANRVGASRVTAVDPSEAFVEAARSRLPDGVEVRRAFADDLPFADDTFDTAVAQLVVQFMPDPVAGLREMARVTKPSGVVAACVWDNAGGAGPLSPLWRAAQELDPAVRDESDVSGAREGDWPHSRVRRGSRTSLPPGSTWRCPSIRSTSGGSRSRWVWALAVPSSRGWTSSDERNCVPGCSMCSARGPSGRASPRGVSALRWAADRLNAFPSRAGTQDPRFSAASRAPPVGRLTCAHAPTGVLRWRDARSGRHGR